MRFFPFRKTFFFLLALVFLALLVWLGANFYKNKFSSPSSNELNLRSQGNRQKGYDVDIHPAVDFAYQVMKPEYVPLSIPTTMIFTPYTNMSMSWFKSNTWTAGGKNVSLEGWQTIGGDKFPKSFMPIEYDVSIKDKISANLSQKDKFMLLNKYFFSAVDLNSLEIKETPTQEQKIRDVYASDEFGANAPIETTVVGNSKIIEGTWKNNAGELESRMVWTLGSEGDTETVYFIACRVFPLSNNYNKNTCVGRNL